MIAHKKTSFYVLILMLVFGSVGFLINQSLFADYEQFSRKHWDKIRRVVELVNYYYVEDVEWDDAVEGAVIGMLYRAEHRLIETIYITSAPFQFLVSFGAFVLCLEFIIQMLHLLPKMRKEG